MPTSRPLREQRRAEAEHRLLVAAAELVGEVGPANVTLAVVGERAGYSRGLADDRAFRREIEQRVGRRIAAGDAPAATDPAALVTVMVAMLRGVALQSLFDDEIDIAAARSEIERMIIDRTRRDAADDGGRGS